MKKQKKIMYCLYLISFIMSFFNLFCMHEEELKKKQDDAVKKLWIPQAALALRCMEEAER